MPGLITRPAEAMVSPTRTQSHRTQARPAEQVQPSVPITCQVHGGEEGGRSSWEVKAWDQAPDRYGVHGTGMAAMQLQCSSGGPQQGEPLSLKAASK